MISTAAWRDEKFGPTLPKLGQYDLFPEYIHPCYRDFSSKKVLFAKDIAEHISSDNSKDILDLKKQVEKLYSLIQKWNY